jgi:hypothetical protein
MNDHKALQKGQRACARDRLARQAAIFYADPRQGGCSHPSIRGSAPAMKTTTIGIISFLLLLATAVETRAGEHRQWPDNFQSRLEVLALIETLNGDLLASRSATETLTEWCAAHHMSAEPKIAAQREKDAAKPVSAAQRQELAIGPDEPVVYRHVNLACGDHILSEADNWYVPSRLTPEMNAALTSSDIPFGRVVRPLNPRRQTIAVTILWQPLPRGWEIKPQPPGTADQHLIIPPLLFEHRAVVYRADGKPIADVDESYRADILDFSSAQ